MTYRKWRCTKHTSLSTTNAPKRLGRTLALPPIDVRITSAACKAVLVHSQEQIIETSQIPALDHSGLGLQLKLWRP